MSINLLIGEGRGNRIMAGQNHLCALTPAPICSIVAAAPHTVTSDSKCGKVTRRKPPFAMDGVTFAGIPEDDSAPDAEQAPAAL